MTTDTETTEAPPRADLGKWPRLLVVGADVTPEQAGEIIVRTDAWMLIGNDRDWERQLAAVLDVPFDDRTGIDWRTIHPICETVGVLPLEYLNNARIYSSWIGGPHGWVDWRGRVGCSSYNLGKWPTVGEVTAEWCKIAEAFPYLSLRAQLLGEEGEGPVLADWVVDSGECEELTPGARLTLPTEPNIDMISLLVRDSGRERGCTIEQLTAALDRCGFKPKRPCNPDDGRLTYTLADDGVHLVCDNCDWPGVVLGHFATPAEAVRCMALHVEYPAVNDPRPTGAPT